MAPEQKSYIIASPEKVTIGAIDGFTVGVLVLVLIIIIAFKWKHKPRQHEKKPD